MELSYFLAQLMGLSFSIFALIGLARPRLIRDAVLTIEVDTFPSLLFGFNGILVGLAIVLSHNIWELSWVGFVTLIGWAALLKGVVFLLSPGSLLKFGTKVYAHSGATRGILFALLLVSAYVAYKGFGY